MSFQILIALIGSIAGFFLVGFINYRIRQHITKEAEAEGQELVAQTQQQIEEEAVNMNRKLEEFRLMALEKLESEIQPKIEKTNLLKVKVEDFEVLLQEKFIEQEKVFNRKMSLVDRHDNQVQQKKKKVDQLKSNVIALKQNYRTELINKSSANIDELKVELMETIEIESRKLLNKESQKIEELTPQEIEKGAKRIIHIALNRFARPYCPERGIHYVNLQNEKVRERIFGEDRRHLKSIEALCGVDLIYREDMNSLSVSGFDPVRRELARSALEQLIKEKQLDEKNIRRVVERIKRNLFKKIKSDGRKITKELALPRLHPEIINMMGALRYRYSFAQNQYFHCAEVGFMCGLLASELKIDLKDARRAGMLHDIGKAMDHSIDGGHAVIGADFIEKNKEPSHIVHAVRAHHYDEDPSTDLAFLVIAADALSGARPGARRSTADAYMQKMGQLETIGNSFPQVTDTFIMGAGREVRVRVNSQTVSDKQAVDLSKQIASRIEDECNYPGLIKVTVVRSTHAVDYAK